MGVFELILILELILIKILELILINIRIHGDPRININ